MNFGDFAAWFTGTQTTGGVTTPFTTRILLEQSLHIVKVGVNYRFGTPSLLAQEPPARPSEGFNWTGAYVGAVAGYGIGRKNWVDFPEQFDVSGALAGGTVGANVHVGRFVFGVEGEWMWTGIKGDMTETTDFGGGLTQTTALATRINWLATAAARVGVVTADRWLNYVKVGFALADETHDLRFDQTLVGVGSTSSDFSGGRLHTGFLIGVGTEYAFFSNWSVKAEYNYVQFAQQTAMLTGIQNLNIRTGPGRFHRQPSGRQHQPAPAPVQGRPELSLQQLGRGARAVLTSALPREIQIERARPVGIRAASYFRRR